MKFFDKILEILFKPRVYVPILAITIGYFIYRIIKSGVKRALEYGSKSAYETKKRKTIVELSSNVIKYIIVVIVGIIILETYGIDTKSIIAGLGVFSAVIGLAFQDTLKDFISGITIILENYYIVGDYVTINGFTGEVIELGLKSTKLKNFDGDILAIANRNVTQAINLSQTRSIVYLKLDVAYEEPVEKTEKVLNMLIPEFEKIQYVMKNSVKYLGVDTLNDSSVRYMVKIECVQDKQWQVRRDALRLVKMTFDREDIKIPYPQIEVHNGK